MTRYTSYELRLLAINTIRRIGDHRSVLVLALVLCGSLVVTAHRGLTHESGHSKLPAAIPEPGSQSVKSNLAQLPITDKRGLHGIVFTLYPVGIEPATLHTTKGLVSISIEDDSGGTAGLVLERETGKANASPGQ